MKMNEKGWEIIRDFFTEVEAKTIINQAEVLDSLPDVLIYYERDDPTKVSRIEKFSKNTGKDFQQIVVKVKNYLESISGSLDLFKDKINYKLPGGGAFKPHQDHPAWDDFPATEYITSMFLIDDHTLENGCLEFSDYSGNEILKYNSETDGAIVDSGSFEWKPVIGSPKDLVIFNSFVPHKSEKNNSETSRRAMFLTWCSGDYYDDYFKKKQEEFPPGSTPKGYSKYNLANPIV